MARVTIIDDDVEFAGNIATILSGAGHSTTVINTLAEAIPALTGDMPDLLVLDVMFPDNPIAGFEIAREIRNTSGVQNLPIIMLTSVNQEFPMDFSLEDAGSEWMPVQDFVEKASDPSVLIEKVRAMTASPA